MIESKIKNQEYKSIAELQADFHKLFANAMQYNMQGSEVYEDAVEMKKLFDNTLQTLRKKSQPKDEEESKKIKQ
jgi:ATP-dependent helicase STH1/SNF2